MTQPRSFLECSAGAAIGLLVGLIAGLSVSPVTSTILGALSTGLLILLGFKSSNESDNSESHASSVLGFGLFCSIALVAGVYLRTHRVLSPSLDQQKQQLATVFTSAQINEILLSTNYGLHPPGMTASSGESSSAGFLRAGSGEFCQVARREQFQDVRAYIDELRRTDSKVAAVIESVPPNYQDSLSKSLSRFLCP